MRKITHIFLSLVIVYATTTSAYANTSIGGWSVVDTVIAGANTTINAVKTSGGKAVKSAITIAPQAGKVGARLLLGGSVLAIGLAVSQTLGDGIDWVLDPANNRVKYKNPDIPQTGLIYRMNYSGSDFSSISDGCNQWYIDGAMSTSVGWVHKPSVNYGDGTFSCHVEWNDGSSRRSTSGTYFASVPTQPSDDWKSIPIDSVAAKVISNASAGDVPSQEAVKAAALEGFAAGEHDAALDAAAVPDTGVENPPDPNNPADPADPAVPFDPSSIIAAINALKAMLAGIMSSIGELTGFMNSELPPEKTKEETNVPVDAPPDVKNPNEFDVNYIGFSSQCPTLSPFSVGIGAVSSSMTFDMTPLCNLAVTIRPAITAIAYFIGLGVIASAIRET